MGEAREDTRYSAATGPSIGAGRKRRTGEKREKGEGRGGEHVGETRNGTKKRQRRKGW